MTQVNIFLGFKDQAEEAFQLYSQIFRRPIAQVLRVRDMPGGEQFPDSAADKIAWMALDLGNVQLWGEDRGYFAPYDAEPANPAEIPRQFISVTLADAAEADSIMSQLSQGGQVLVPLAPNFFSAYYGRLTDRYGMGWELLVASSED